MLGSPTKAQIKAEPRRTGFTLVEVLITLVLLSMVAAVAFGSLRQVLEARGRLRPYLDRSQETTLVASWFRQTVEAMIADYDNGQHHFAGTAIEISGLTTAPLIGPPGTPITFHWALKYDAARDITTLEYQESPSQTMPIVSWTGHAGNFNYYAEDQKWYPIWPPADTDQSKPPVQLPQLVRLSGMPRDRIPMVVAAPRSSLIGPRLQTGVFGDIRRQ